MRFVGEDALLGRAAAPALLPAQFLNALPLGVGTFATRGFDLVEEQLPGKDTVLSLLTGGLALDLNARGPVHQHHARGDLVHVLPAVSAGTDEAFLNVVLANSERGHAQSEGVIGSGVSRLRAHAMRVEAQSTKFKAQENDKDQNR